MTTISRASVQKIIRLGVLAGGPEVSLKFFGFGSMAQ